jgi:hypothetical protein
MRMFWRHNCPTVFAFLLLFGSVDATAQELPITFAFEQLAIPVTGNYFQELADETIASANKILADNNCNLKLKLLGDPIVAELPYPSDSDYQSRISSIPGTIKLIHPAVRGSASYCVGTRSYLVYDREGSLYLMVTRQSSSVRNPAQSSSAISQMMSSPQCSCGESPIYQASRMPPHR